MNYSEFRTACIERIKSITSRNGLCNATKCLIDYTEKLPEEGIKIGNRTHRINYTLCARDLRELHVAEFNTDIEDVVRMYISKALLVSSELVGGVTCKRIHSRRMSMQLIADRLIALGYMVIDYTNEYITFSWK